MFHIAWLGLQRWGKEGGGLDSLSGETCLWYSLVLNCSIYSSEVCYMPSVSWTIRFHLFRLYISVVVTAIPFHIQKKPSNIIIYTYNFMEVCIYATTHYEICVKKQFKKYRDKLFISRHVGMSTCAVSCSAGAVVLCDVKLARRYCQFICDVSERLTIVSSAYNTYVIRYSKLTNEITE